MGTLLHRLAAWVAEEPETIAQKYQKDGQWHSITCREYLDRVYWLALFLESRGMTSADVSTIFAYNSPAWVHLDLAAGFLGAKSAGIYPNSSAKDISYVLEHTESKFLAVGSREYFKKIQTLPARVKVLLALDDDTSFSPLAVSYTAALAEGQEIAQQQGAQTFQAYLDALDPQAGAFLIYTSGTTGNPKGAVISHDNLVYTIDTAGKYWGLPFRGGVLFSFLPLCHIAEKVQNIGGGIMLRYAVSFCSGFEHVSTEIPQVQPTLLLCVPRLWEKMMEGVEAKRVLASSTKQKLITWAFRVGTKRIEGALNGKLSLLDLIQWSVADRLVASKIRHALGLGRAKVLVSGAAPLAPHVCLWFRNLGIELMEVFGQTESTGIICLTIPGRDCAGTVGKPVPGFETLIAEDGEILTRGRHVFKGYFKDRDATESVLEGGWLHTGDLAEWNADQLLKIRGRKKEILKTSGGKMVAPAPIEEALKEAPMISQVCMVGDGRKYLSALITLNQAKMDEIEKMEGAIQGLTLSIPGLMKEIKAHVEQLNRSLASYEQIKRFAIMSKEFTVIDGEMTPTLKMKRKVIENRYRDVIEGLY